MEQQTMEKTLQQFENLLHWIMMLPSLITTVGSALF